MNSNVKTKLSSFLNQAIIFLLIAYTFVMLGRVIYQNFELNKQTEEIKTEISSVEIKNQNLSNLILYYQSESFRDVEIRSQLNLKKPGETEIILPQKPATDFPTEVQEEANQLATPSKTNNQNSNAALWWQYFFK